MKLIRRDKKSKFDPVKAFLNLDHPFCWLSLFPFSEIGLATFHESWAPIVDVSEDNKNIYVRADLPGLKKEDIQVSLDQGVLTIKGERRSESKQKEFSYYRTERFSGEFQRRLDLGINIDHTRIKANYKDGVLDLTFPKSEDNESKDISIN